MQGQGVTAATTLKGVESLRRSRIFFITGAPYTKPKAVVTSSSESFENGSSNRVGAVVRASIDGEMRCLLQFDKDIYGISRILVDVTLHLSKNKG